MEGMEGWRGGSGGWYSDVVMWCTGHWVGAEPACPHGIGPGNADGSMQALGAGRSLIFQCPHCYAMVDLRAATRATGIEHRSMQAGDGCTGCSKYYHAKVHVETQVNRLAALREGERTFIAMPRPQHGEHARLHLGMNSLCTRAEAALIRVAKAAGYPMP